MRFMTLDVCVDHTRKLFDKYVQYYCLAQCTGMVPTAVLEIHRRGSAEKLDMASVRFKNSLTISVFTVSIYLEDIFRMARECKIWLLDEEIFDVIVLYCMIHPIAQNQHLKFEISTENGMSMMMVNAGKDAYDFISRAYAFESDVGRNILEILRYHMMADTNNWWGIARSGSLQEDYANLQEWYEDYMMATCEPAYRVARFRKATTSLIDHDGFLIPERHTAGMVDYGLRDKVIREKMDYEYDLKANHMYKKADAKQRKEMLKVMQEGIEHREEVILKRRKKQEGKDAHEQEDE